MHAAGKMNILSTGGFMQKILAMDDKMDNL